MKKTILAFTIVILLLEVYFLMVFNSKPQVIDTLVIYEKDSDEHIDAYQHLRQTLVANTNVETMPISVLNSVDLTNYEVIYLDPSIIGSKYFDHSKAPIEHFVKEGGYLFLENEFYKEFPKDFIGARDFQKIKRFPNKLKYPAGDRNVSGIQKLVEQFNQDMAFESTKEFEGLDLGVGLIPSTAQSIVSNGELSLYSLNEHGDGTVFFASELLPNDHYVTRYDFQKQYKDQEDFHYTFTAGNFLFRNEYITFVAKDMYGYAVSKVLGTHGRPGVAIQHTLKENSGLSEQKLDTFLAKIEKEKLIPSLSLPKFSYSPDTWKESISYFSNTGSENQLSFNNKAEKMKIAADRDSDLQTYPDKLPLDGEVKLPYHAYIDIKDMNEDGVQDLIAGSSNGKIYFYEGSLEKEEWILHPKGPLKLETGQPIDLGDYASPRLVDYNQDGNIDIISGNRNGKIVVLLRNEDNEYALPEEIIDVKKDYKYIMPEIGDIDADGIDDLIYGTESGDVYFHTGEEAEDEKDDNNDVKNASLHFSEVGHKLTSNEGNIRVKNFAAPKLLNYDNNDQPDLLIGSGSGFIKRFELNKGQFIDRGYMLSSKINPFGDNRLWNGKNSVPVMTDVDGDQTFDLIVGLLAYGDEHSIDSPNYPYKDTLSALADKAKQNKIRIYPHLYLNTSKDNEAYLKDLGGLKEAFQTYNFDWKPSGITFTIDPFRLSEKYDVSEVPNLKDIWWYEKMDVTNEGKTNLWTFPFTKMNEKTIDDKVYHEPHTGRESTLSKFDLPFINEIKNIDELDHLSNFKNFVTGTDYNVMTTEQLYKSILATHQTTSTLNYNPIEKVTSDFQNLIRRKLHHTVYINEDDQDTNHELINPYEHSIGYKVEMGEKYKGFVFSTDAPVYTNIGSTLYFSGKDNIKLKLKTQYENEPHIMQSNVPIRIDQQNNSVTINFLETGMQQIKIFAPDGIKMTSKEWDVQQNGSTYILTRYGEETSLNYSYK
ncbi:VCBS repeat-containing protein [Alkalihalobacillus sp. TS-13]|uniref:FG-GAP repeat domain-containing protein n=1 Tax=Alkalihalobacillus sp. TS-13 TaxID=2842455 RepID=UPI001C880DA9|nr:VCBS repeat-containing protein [Alkalihalobacillus sp. TS-13]